MNQKLLKMNLINHLSAAKCVILTNYWENRLHIECNDKLANMQLFF
jgi:hypothetical protein